MNDLVQFMNSSSDKLFLNFDDLKFGFIFMFLSKEFATATAMGLKVN